MLWLLCWGAWLLLAAPSSAFLFGFMDSPDEATFGLGISVAAASILGGMAGEGFVSSGVSAVVTFLAVFFLVPIPAALHLFLAVGPAAVNFGDGWLATPGLAGAALAGCYAVAMLVWFGSVRALSGRELHWSLAAGGGVMSLAVLAASCWAAVLV